MKRSAPLKRGKPLKRSQMRATPKARARKTQRREAWRQASTEAQQRSGGACEARIAENCTGRGAEAHHKLPRRYGDDSAANCLWCCDPCHDWITEHPEDAYEAGLLLKGNGRPLRKGRLMEGPICSVCDDTGLAKDTGKPCPFCDRAALGLLRKGNSNG